MKKLITFATGVAMIGFLFIGSSAKDVACQNDLSQNITTSQFCK